MFCEAFMDIRMLESFKKALLRKLNINYNTKEKKKHNKTFLLL